MSNTFHTNFDILINESNRSIQAEINDRFNDAIYRVLKDTKVTAEELWEELKIVQESPILSASYTAASILNELNARGQHKADWR